MERAPRAKAAIYRTARLTGEHYELAASGGSKSDGFGSG